MVAHVRYNSWFIFFLPSSVNKLEMIKFNSALCRDREPRRISFSNLYFEFYVVFDIEFQDLTKRNKLNDLTLEGKF